MKKVTIVALLVLLIAGLFVSCDDDASDNYVRISFSPNGGTGSMEPLFVNAGVATHLPSNSFSYQWKVFDGWATSPGGSKAYENLQEVAFSSNTTLYAVWADMPRIEVTKDTSELVGGKVYETTKDVTINRRVEVKGTDPVKLILGDNTTLTIVGGIHLVEEQDLTIDGNGALVANAEADDFKDSSGIGGDRFEEGGAVTIKGGKVTATGGMNAVAIGAGSGEFSQGDLVIGKDWSLAGDDENGETFRIGPATEDTVYEGTRYRYMRTIAPVTVTFMSNSEDAKGEMVPQKVPYGVQKSLNENKFKSDLSSFTEWNTRPDAKGQSYSDEETVRLTEDLTLYAIWVHTSSIITSDTEVLVGGNLYRTDPKSKATSILHRVSIQGTETVTLTITKGTTLNMCGITVESGQELKINVDEGALLIANAGALDNYTGAGIGGAGAGAAGIIVINGPGTIIAQGGSAGGAGIGGGFQGSAGEIYINSGIIEATGGKGAAGIGGGANGSGGSITINSGKIEAHGGTDGSAGGAGIGGGNTGGSGTIYIGDGRVNAVGGSDTAHGIGHGSGTTTESDIGLSPDILIRTSTDQSHWDEYLGDNRHRYMNAAKSLILDENTTELKVGYVYILNSINSKTDIVVPNRLTVTGAEKGEVVLFLSEGMTLTAEKGIGVSNRKLSIEGTGTLVSGTEEKMGDQNNNPGIGGNDAVITIYSGTVTANGGPLGAGIGGQGSLVTIETGTVTAKGGTKGQGIGGTNSTTKINNGTVTATGGKEAVGIGGPTTTVTIRTGKVTVEGGENCSAIGGSNCNITINDGTVTATAGNGGSGIGGYQCSVTIDKGTIKAYGKGGGSGIGGGTGCDSGTIKINGGDIFACGGATGIDAIGRGSGSIAPRNTTIAKDLKFVASDNNNNWFPFSSVPRRYMKTGTEGPQIDYIDSNTTKLYPGLTYTIDGNVTNDNRLWIDGTSDVDVMIYLPAGKQLTLLCGIDVVEGQNLCIDGDPSGVLKAMAPPETSSKDYYRVAIGSPLVPDGKGSYEYLKCGNIRINGGCIYAYGGEEYGDREYGTTAIGGRDCAIFINGGEVNAYGYGDGAAIGSPGRTNKSTYYNAKVIYITGGTVNAYGFPTRDTDGGAGIGTGYKGKYIDEVLITGGTVNAVGGGEDGCGIGGANGFEGGTVTIQGGYVTTSAVGKKIYGIGPRNISFRIGRDGSPMKLFGVLYDESHEDFLFEGRGWFYEYDKKKVYTQMKVTQ